MPVQICRIRIDKCFPADYGWVGEVGGEVDGEVGREVGGEVVG